MCSEVYRRIILLNPTPGLCKMKGGEDGSSFESPFPHLTNERIPWWKGEREKGKGGNFSSLDLEEGNPQIRKREKKAFFIPWRRRRDVARRFGKREKGFSGLKELDWISNGEAPHFRSQSRALGAQSALSLLLLTNIRLGNRTVSSFLDCTKFSTRHFPKFSSWKQKGTSWEKNVDRENPSCHFCQFFAVCEIEISPTATNKIDDFFTLFLGKKGFG